MNVVEVYEWLSKNKSKAEYLYTVLKTSEITYVMSAMEKTGEQHPEDAYTRLTAMAARTAEDNLQAAKVRKLLENSTLILYHGNKDKNMVPRFGFGKKDCDFGQGFYTTPDKELGKEWAYSSYTQGGAGFIHTYELCVDGLNVYNLTEDNSLSWIAEILSNRALKYNDFADMKEILEARAKAFIKRYKPDTANADVIIGYRADDSYFKYATDFIADVLYKETLDKALYYGNLGLQVFVRSEKAFEQLKKISTEEVDRGYAKLFAQRDKAARAMYEEHRLSKGKTRIRNYLSAEEM